HENARLMTKVARLYHEQGLSQPNISSRLHISQSRVSRLLSKATEVGIVRTTVVNTAGVYSELEDLLEKKYAVSEIVIVDTAEGEEQLLKGLGSAAAHYLESTLTGGDRIGISSWSASLLSTVEAMRPKVSKVADEVVQVIGGVGESNAQAFAVRLVGRLSEVTGARVSYLPAPGLVNTPEAARALFANQNIADVLKSVNDLTLLLVGIGSIEPSKLLKESGNSLSEKERKELAKLGAVGDVCMRYFDENGKGLKTNLDKRIIGIQADQLKKIPRRVAVAGGTRKLKAIKAALEGGWVNVLITDYKSARKLAE
ncbi:MAG: sugar-binding transcriptional regulator, partial [Actinobacteria bacterium]|nr:sugar-binding transcriptional regulator [Actinomycetota bacterium]